jgi:hypothetical protein
MVFQLFSLEYVVTCRVVRHVENKEYSERREVIQRSEMNEIVQSEPSNDCYEVMVEVQSLGDRSSKFRRS